jgi:hypothetical protein
VAKNSKGAYQFISVEEGFKFIVRQSVYINEGSLRKGEYTSNDRYLFLAIDNSGGHSIVRVNTQNYAVTFVTDEDGSSKNQKDFTLFEANLNRMVTLAVKDKSYYLQLRTIDSLRLVDEFPLSFGFSIMDYKLVGSIEWDFTFGLGIKVEESSYRNDSKLYMYKVDGDRILDLGLSRDTNFSNLRACYKYVLTYDEWSPLTISALHYSNLSLAFLIDAFGSEAVKFEKNIVILTIYTS